MSVDIIGANSGYRAEVDSANRNYVVSPVLITPVSISSNGASNQANCAGYIGIGLQLTSLGTGGTIAFEGSGDANNWVAMTGVPNPNGPAVTSTSAAGAWQFDGTGVPYFRVRATALSSGNITGSIILTSQGSIAQLESGSYSNLTGSEYGWPVRNINSPSTTTVSSNAAANTALTVTLPAPGAGNFHYITGIEITRSSNAALTGNATLQITTTNMSGNRAWRIGNAMAAGGTAIDVNIDRTSPIKSNAANTATTIVMPAAGAGVQWNCNVDYFIGP